MLVLRIALQLARFVSIKPLKTVLKCEQKSDNRVSLISSYSYLIVRNGASPICFDCVSLRIKSIKKAYLLTVSLLFLVR